MFYIPAQPLQDAIAAFARQADIQVLISANDAHDKRNHEVRGEFDVPKALTSLLRGTGLVAREAAPQTYVVVPAAHAKAAVPQVSNTWHGSDEASQQLDQIIVTAQKREENLQQTPVSLSAANDSKLEAQRIVDASQLPELSPGVSVSYYPSSPTTLLLYIRGIGNDNGALSFDSPTTVYINGVPEGRQSALVFDMLELERVEVLRGPQGTLYGRNTIGGAVNFITKRPAADFAVGETLTGGSFGHFESRTRLDTGALGDTGLTSSFSFVHKENNGYVQNTAVSDPAKWPGAVHADAFRGHAVWVYGSKVKAEYIYDAAVQNAVPLATQLTALYPEGQTYYGASPRLGGSTPVASPDRLSQLALNDNVEQHAAIQGHTISVEVKFSDALRVKLLSGYRRFDLDNPGLNVGGNAGLRGVVLNQATQSLQVEDVNPALVQEYDHQHQYSEELDVSGAAFDRTVDYVAGAFYFYERSHQLFPSSSLFSWSYRTA